VVELEVRAEKLPLRLPHRFHIYPEEKFLAQVFRYILCFYRKGLSLFL
jgi:hypothetical protein